MDFFTTPPRYIFLKTKNKIDGTEYHCAGSFRIWNFSWSVFSQVCSEYRDLQSKNVFSCAFFLYDRLFSFQILEKKKKLFTAQSNTRRY